MHCGGTAAAGTASPNPPFAPLDCSYTAQGLNASEQAKINAHAASLMAAVSAGVESGFVGAGEGSLGSGDDGQQHWINNLCAVLPTLLPPLSSAAATRVPTAPPGL